MAADGIEILVKPTSLFAPEFEDELKKLKTPEARASEMEHALREEIHVRLDDDPVFLTSLRERLEQNIEDRKAKRIDAAKQLLLFDEVEKKIHNRAQTADTLGLSDTGLAIYGLISERKPLNGASCRRRGPSSTTCSPTSSRT
ncbi:type I restriction enzyme endonuclease domain-containing protein [Sorangium sp. So ce296]|uniref:type I restriction enzyme endonuclease domain-containing protein n=1 Tax=Sorangium sp. So ce296 TaxID=3133296 RepID=UPI003F62D3D2